MDLVPLRREIMRMRVLVTLIRLATTCAFVLTAYLLGQDRGGTPPGDGRMEIGGVFSKADASGSLEYWGICDFKDFYPDFPKLRKISGNKESALESLRDMFSVDPEMRVSQDSDGKIRMREKDVPSDLLDVKIHVVHFPVQFHGPNAAVIAILQSPEVVAYQKEHNIGPSFDPEEMGNYPSEAFGPARPRVYGRLHDVTVRQALDYVLRTFHGFWLYENCKGPGDSRLVYFDFIENAPSAVVGPMQK